MSCQEACAAGMVQPRSDKYETLAWRRFRGRRADAEWHEPLQNIVDCRERQELSGDVLVLSLIITVMYHRRNNPSLLSYSMSKLRIITTSLSKPLPGELLHRATASDKLKLLAKSCLPHLASAWFWHRWRVDSSRWLHARWWSEHARMVDSMATCSGQDFPAQAPNPTA